MDIKTGIEIAGFALLILGGLWRLNKNMVNEFQKIKDSQTKNYHSMDLRLNSIENTVSPYAQQIANLQKRQIINMAEISKLSSLSTDIARIERQIESLQNLQRKG